MDVKWRYGWFIGRSIHSDQNYLALSDGTVTRARAMVRLLPTHRWDKTLLDVLTATPGDEQSPTLDLIEAEPNPHEHASAEHPEEVDEDTQAHKKRFKIT